MTKNCDGWSKATAGATGKKQEIPLCSEISPMKSYVTFSIKLCGFYKDEVSPAAACYFTFTFVVNVFLVPSFNFTVVVILAVPFFFAVTFPLELTLAIFFLSLL